METHDQAAVDRLIDEEETRATDRYQNDLVSAASIPAVEIELMEAWEKKRAEDFWKKHNA